MYLTMLFILSCVQLECIFSLEMNSTFCIVFCNKKVVANDSLPRSIFSERKEYHVISSAFLGPGQTTRFFT